MLRNHNFNLHDGSGSKMIVPKNIAIMEIKFNNIIPNWVINIIQRNDTIQQKISKFARGLTQTVAFSYI